MASLQDFFGRGEVFVRQLIAENQRLRSELHEAHPGRDDLPAQHSASIIEDLMARVAELEVAAAATEAADDEDDDDTDTDPSDSARVLGLTERVEQLEDENYHLASMYVAGLQFHSARTLAEVLQTVTEILLNFVGVGAFTVFMLDEERQMLFALVREGGDIEACGEVPVHGEAGALGPFAAMIQRARPWTRGDPAYADDNAILYLPLVSNRRLVAVLRLEGFLPQKPGFDDNDFSLLSMISEHAGIAIETAWIRAHAKTVPLQRQAVEHLVGA
ncbi:GAF domain-containing protein [Nannocystis sp.]|uniref:GAF domain-containing protein n=1 Tax=Nannocystis sp. TaxID=1962667 RepID=UPI00242694DE|nr:GAF domain-containing protein [Nannocystis sp.]MBK7827782.1 GAF domain-containing protein [Nannocystis sp.]MBK9753822.1 GAF domain-containing protein [Nannocystis sp.]